MKIYCTAVILMIKAEEIFYNGVAFVRNGPYLRGIDTNGKLVTEMKFPDDYFGYRRTKNILWFETYAAASQQAHLWCMETLLSNLLINPVFSKIDIDALNDSTGLVEFRKDYGWVILTIRETWYGWKMQQIHLAQYTIHLT